MTITPINYSQLHSEWTEYSVQERMTSFKSLPLADAQEFFRQLSTLLQCEVISNLPEGEQTVWMRLLDPDDAADLLQDTHEEHKERLL
ncbi:MAG: hypothetical protein K2X81_25485, partial [Candidatus Obscuribacterales bacterium]|nr:hypothetical protein [Candidatus Obscuribacterales bacterium]